MSTFLSCWKLPWDQQKYQLVDSVAKDIGLDWLKSNQSEVSSKDARRSNDTRSIRGGHFLFVTNRSWMDDVEMDGKASGMSLARGPLMTRTASAFDAPTLKFDSARGKGGDDLMSTRVAASRGPPSITAVFLIRRKPSRRKGPTVEHLDGGANRFRRASLDSPSGLSFERWDDGGGGGGGSSVATNNTTKRPGPKRTLMADNLLVGVGVSTAMLRHCYRCRPHPRRRVDPDVDPAALVWNCVRIDIVFFLI